MWYCEECKKNVSVLVQTGEQEFDRSDSEDHIIKTVKADVKRNLLMRCIDCDSNDVNDDGK